MAWTVWIESPGYFLFLLHWAAAEQGCSSSLQPLVQPLSVALSASVRLPEVKYKNLFGTNLNFLFPHTWDFDDLVIEERWLWWEQH